MGRVVGAVWRIEWHTPYTNPPDGQPREIYRRYVKIGSPDFNHVPSDVLEKWVPGEWSIYWSAICEPLRSMSREGKAAIRRKNLRRRMEKKYPLFAEKFIQEEMEARPKYFDGHDSLEAQRLRKEVLDNEYEVYKAWKEAVRCQH